MAACLRPLPSQLIQVAQDPLDSAVPFVLLVLLLGRPFAGPLGRLLVTRWVLANLAFAQIGDGEPSLDFLGHAKEDFSLLFNRHLGFASCAEPRNVVCTPLAQRTLISTPAPSLGPHHIYLRERRISAYLIILFLVDKYKLTLVDLLLYLLFPGGAISCPVAP